MLVIVLVFVTVPACASALLARGHVFATTFGTSGSGDGQLDGPSDVAVSESSGDLYVVDAGNERVEVFKPNGADGFQYASQFKVRSPAAIAVDNSTSAADPTRGDVYIAGGEEREASERNEIYEYSPAKGAIVHKWKTFKVKEKHNGEAVEEELELDEISGLAVDASGVLWVYWEEEGNIDGFAKSVSSGESPLLSWQPGSQRRPDVEAKFECFARPAFAVAPGDKSFYVGYEHENGEEECPGERGETADATAVAQLDGAAPLPRTVLGALDHQDTTGVAVDPSTEDVYLDNQSSVAAFTASGLLIQRFGAGQIAGGAGIAVDVATGQVFVPELGEDKVAVFDSEETAEAPAVDGLTARALSPQSEQLSAQIDPRGAHTEYSFQYGTAACQTSPSECTVLTSGVIPPRFGDQTVTATVTGLSPASDYFFRLTAANTAGGDEAGPVAFATLPSAGGLPDGRAWEMVTPPDKHGAAVEVVSRTRGGSIQAAADGNGIVWLATGPVVSEPQGNRSFELTQLISQRGSEGWATQSLETPHEAGRGLILPSPSEYHFFTADLSQSLVEPTEPAGQVGGVVEHPPLSPEATEKTPYLRRDGPEGTTFTPIVTPADDTARTLFGGGLEFLDASSDLSHVVLESKVGLTAQDASASGLYEWDAASRTPALVSVLPDGTPAPDEKSAAGSQEPVLGDGGGLNARDAVSADGSRVFWSEERQQIPEALYMRDSETGETVLVSEAQGHGATEPATGGEDIPEPLQGHQQVHFQAASSDGSRVFFTDTAKLTESSAQEPVGEQAPADLYEFETTSQPGQPLRGRLVDLSADPSSGSGDVLNLIPGASSDGTSVYVVANGVLAPGATPGECPRGSEPQEPPQPTATCNLYLERYNQQTQEWQAPVFIAALSYQDAADWGAGLSSNLLPSHDNLAAVSSSVSPDGRYLAFMSQQSLTGYDNQSTHGARAQEVFLYDSSTGSLTCASCNPNGQSEWKRPEGVFDTEAAGEGLGLLVDRPEIWREHWLAGSIPGWTFNIFYGAPDALYQPRYLSDSGRLFFNSPEELVLSDTNGKEDVYEYEPEGVGSCAFSAGCIGLISSGTSSQASTFLDASENGDDVFFLTSSQLVPQDTDDAPDIYDARVCTEASPCLTSNSSSTHGCESTATCRSANGTPPPQVPATPSATITATGNHGGHGVPAFKTATKPAARPLTRAQKLALALKACRKIKHKHARVRCETDARRHYAPKRKTSNTRTKASKGARSPKGRHSA